MKAVITPLKPAIASPAAAIVERLSAASTAEPGCSAFLVGADELVLFQDVAFHRSLELRLGRLAEVAQHGVERIELVKIPVLALRRAGTAISCALPVVDSFAGATRQVFASDRRRQSGRIRWDVVEHPVNPGHLRCRRVRGIRVIYDQREALRAGRQAAPCEWDRSVAALAGVDPWDGSPLREGGRCQ